jgi:Na+/proline symporter
MVFLILVLAIGIHAARSVKGESDFFLGGRKMGKALQFFLNFGNATDSNAAPTMASQVYGQGVSGMWLQLQTLFFTPLFWFTQPWYRRARVITMADLFMERFNSKSVASAYAIFNVVVALITLGVGNYAAYSVVEAMLVKSPAAYTLEDKASVAGFHRLQDLKKIAAANRTPELQSELTTLQERDKRGELHERIPALKKWEFYLAYNSIVGIYIMLGGLKAAAITDAVQGILILFMSIILLPLGLYKIGGFSGLHAHVPEASFFLAGTPSSDFTIYSIVAVTVASFIQIMGLQHNMGSAGSATNENTARFGMIVGGFTKRLVLICWMLCGLLAVAILSGPLKLDKPDLAWGALSTYLLPTGLVGLMLSGMLLGHMPAVGMTAVAVSGLVTRNLYEPAVKGMTAKHYLRVGQLVIVLVLALSVGIAWFATSLGSLTTIMITFNTFFGAVVFLVFFWRRLTVPAIMISFVIWMFLQAVLPPLVGFTNLRKLDALTLQTQSYQQRVSQAATAADVAAGRAAEEGQTIVVQSTVAPAAIFFDKVALREPTKPELGREGLGHFTVETAVLYYPLRAVGLKMEHFSKAQLVTARWSFDAIFPFVCLIVLSWLTRPSAPERAAIFYARQKTPVGATPEIDSEEVEKSYKDPNRFDDRKLFPRSNWEFCKWTRQDYVGFFGCYGIVVAIVALLWLVLHIGSGSKITERTSAAPVAQQVSSVMP